MGKLDIIMCSHTRVIISMRFPLDDDGDAANAEKRLLPVEGQYRHEIDASHLGEKVRGWGRKAGIHLSSFWEHFPITSAVIFFFCLNR